MIHLSLFLLPRQGFNRYMVECEYKTMSALSVEVIRFNRYMVECECYKKADMQAVIKF